MVKEAYDAFRDPQEARGLRPVWASPASTNMGGEPRRSPRDLRGCSAPVAASSATSSAARWPSRWPQVFTAATTRPTP